MHKGSCQCYRLLHQIHGDLTQTWTNTHVARLQASAEMSSLMGMLPAKAVLATTGDVVSVRDVRVGDVVAVRAGEIVPVDGVVVDG